MRRLAEGNTLPLMVWNVIDAELATPAAVFYKSHGSICPVACLARPRRSLKRACGSSDASVQS